MAIAGQRPKPAELRLISGSRSRATVEPQFTGQPRSPVKMAGRPAALWKRYVLPAFWLGAADGPKAWLWCELQAEAEHGVKDMTAARLGQLRNLGSELGFDPVSRARMAKPKLISDTADRYFND